MSTRVICPACGKLNRLPDDATLATTTVCLACGVRIPPHELQAQLPADAGYPRPSAPDVPGGADTTDVPAPAFSTPPPNPRSSAATSGYAAPPAPRHPAPPPRRRGRRALAVAAACLLVGGAAGAIGMYALRPNPAGDVRDLLAMKSEAEELAVAGQLDAAHAKYRALQQRAAGRTFKDPASWDMIDRAKVDQDRIYTILLDKIQAQNPPERAIPRPGTGTVTRADDPWVYPRGGSTPAGGLRGGATEDGTANGTGDAGGGDAIGGAFTEEPQQAVAPPTPAPAGHAGAAREAVAAATEAAPSPPPSSPATGPSTPPPPPSASAAASAPPPAAPTAGSAVASAAAAAVRPPAPPPWVTDDVVTDEEIGYALKKGSDYLLSQVKDGAIVPIQGMTRTKYTGRNALVVYALLQVGRANRDKRLDPRGEFMGRLIDVMKAHEMDRGGREPMQPVVYSRSLRAAALALYNRPQDREALKADAEWLVNASVKGAYSYDDTFSDMGLKESGALAPSTWDDLVEEAAGEAYDDVLDARRYFCHGLHDASGRELDVNWRTPKRPLPQRRPSSIPPPMMPGPQRTPPPAPGMGPGRTARPDNTVFVEPGFRRPGLQPPATERGPSESVDTFVFPWDNSNSQYGLLGVWAAAEAGIEVPRKYWEAVENHWRTSQMKTGEWGYMAGDAEGYLSMTCGGVSSLWVTYDWLVAPRSRGQVGRETMSDALQAGMKWLESADNAVHTPIPGKTHYPGYDLFGLERVGLASGFKYFGSHDWYRKLAAKTVTTQYPNGAWGRDDGHPDGLIETAYQLLFLSHGRHPIFMNKLRFDTGRGEQLNGKPVPGYWANRPRDIANLTRFASRELERPFNWQVVDLRREWHDWLDCPVLYIASHTTPGMGEADYAKLRQFAEAGGLIFTHADAGAASYTRFVVEELVPKTFGANLRAVPLPDDHPIYSVHYDLKKPRPQLWGVSNGSRLLLVHSPGDLGSAWQQRGDRTHTPMFQLGVNLFLYAAGIVDFRNRIDSPYVPPAPAGKHGTVAVARVTYDGDWDPEPGAWRRFANLYQWEMSTNVPVTPTAFADLNAARTPVAHLTGTQPVAFTDAQAAALRKYVEAGGIVLIDPCGGAPAFNKSVRDGLLARAFPDAAPAPLPRNHALLTGTDPTAEPIALKLRRYPAEKLKLPPPQLEHIPFGKGSVILSQVDITSGLLGTNTLTITGYDAPYAQAIVWNLLGWPTPAAGMPVTQPTSD